MIYFLPGNLLSLGFEVSWWLFKNTSYVVYQGIKYGITSITTVSNPQGDGIPSEEDLNIEDSIDRRMNEGLEYSSLLMSFFIRSYS